jgi:hypothetical protein
MLHRRPMQRINSQNQHDTGGTILRKGKWLKMSKEIAEPKIDRFDRRLKFSFEINSISVLVAVRLRSCYPPGPTAAGSIFRPGADFVRAAGPKHKPFGGF